MKYLVSILLALSVLVVPAAEAKAQQTDSPTYCELVLIVSNRPQAAIDTAIDMYTSQLNASTTARIHNDATDLITLALAVSHMMRVNQGINVTSDHLLALILVAVQRDANGEDVSPNTDGLSRAVSEVQYCRDTQI